MRSTVCCLGVVLAWLGGIAVARADAPWNMPAKEDSAGATPAVRLGLPQAIEAEQSGSSASPAGGQPRIVRGQSPDVPPPPAPPPTSVPLPPGAVVPPPPPPPGGAGDVPLLAPSLNQEEAYNCGVVTRQTKSRFGEFFGKAWDTTKGTVIAVPGAVAGVFQPDSDRKLLQTDHCFDAFAAPVSYPLFAEPPQATTELKALFFYDRALAVNPIFAGGYNIFAGGQIRVALTDWFTVVVNRLGGVWMQPNNVAPGFARSSGFSELWLGPKFTLVRNDQCGTLVATGLTFQIPTGPAAVFQDTGNLSIAPYVSVAQKLFPDFKYGGFILWNTTGYAFRTDTVRSEYLYTVFHLSWDVANLHRVYPEVGMNWNLYTRNGTRQAIGFEGIPLFNFGSNNAGRNDLSLATGIRFRITDHLQTGFAFQWGLLRTARNLEDWGITADFRIIY